MTNVNLNRINLIIESFLNKQITGEQMAKLINKYGISKSKLKARLKRRKS